VIKTRSVKRSVFLSLELFAGGIVISQAALAREAIRHVASRQEGNGYRYSVIPVRTITAINSPRNRLPAALIRFFSSVTAKDSPRTKPLPSTLFPSFGRELNRTRMIIRQLDCTRRGVSIGRIVCTFRLYALFVACRLHKVRKRVASKGNIFSANVYECSSITVTLHFFPTISIRR